MVHFKSSRTQSDINLANISCMNRKNEILPYMGTTGIMLYEMESKRTVT